MLGFVRICKNKQEFVDLCKNVKEFVRSLEIVRICKNVRNYMFTSICKEFTRIYNNCEFKKTNILFKNL